MIGLLVAIVALLCCLVVLGVLTLLQLRDMQSNTQARINEALQELEAAEFELAFLRSIDGRE
jgi:hypothetical protein